MSSQRIRTWLAAVVVTVSVLLTGCTADEPDAEPTSDAATVEKPADESQPATITLREDAAERLGIQTAPVKQVPAAHGRAASLSVPYAAIVYDADGQAWAYAERKPLTFKRVALEVSTVAGNTATLAKGPAVGTKVVVVGAAELVGAEAEISGEE